MWLYTPHAIRAETFNCNGMKTLLVFLLAAARALAWPSFTGSSLLQIRRQYNPSRNNNESFMLNMKMDVTIRIVGRKQGSEQWLGDAYDMYTKRLRASPVNVETTWHKNDQELIKGVQSDLDKNHSIVLMDPKGKQRTSEVFTECMFEWLHRGGSRLTFVIGGAEGLPRELLQKNLEKMSLSDMTLTHQFARTMLTEQIYRATEIRKGSGYHK